MTKLDTLLAQLPRYAGAKSMSQRVAKAFIESAIEGKPHVETTVTENDLNLDVDSPKNAVLASMVDGLVEALGIAKSHFEELETECPSGSPESNALIRQTISIGQVLARVAEVRADINEEDKSSNE